MSRRALLALPIRLDRSAAALRLPLLARLLALFAGDLAVAVEVDPVEARALQARLGSAFEPFGGRAEAVLLWRYRGGPWEPAGVFPLSGRPAGVAGS